MHTIERIVAASRPLHERLSAATEAAAAPGAPPDTAQRWKVWCATTANGDQHAFSRRLAWDGLAEDHARRALRSAEEAPASLPAWAATLTEAYGRTRTEVAAAFSRVNGHNRYMDPDEPLPFEYLYRPIVTLARRRVHAQTGVAYDGLSSEAHAALERALLRRLTRTAGQALYADFSAFRTCQFQSEGQLNNEAYEGAYADFLDQMQGGRLITFFDVYSVVARLLGHLTNLWIEATSEFIQRLAEDRPALEAAFHNGRPLGEAKRVEADVADYHEGGRAVLIVHFQGGCKVVYKPRPLHLEAFYAEVLSWLEAHGGLLPLKAIEAVYRSTHGWLEFIAHLPCKDEDEVARFYQRCGMLLCLAYVFNGTDFHFENLIASGEHPVLLDMEGLLRPRFSLEERMPTQDLMAREAREHAVRSVLNTRMLPFLKFLSKGVAVDTSSLGMTLSTRSAIDRWANVNEDSMRIERRVLPTEERYKNILFCDGRPVRAADHVIDIGPGAGVHGGQVIAQGTPEKVAKVKKSYTGSFLKKVLAEA